VQDVANAWSCPQHRSLLSAMSCKPGQVGAVYFKFVRHMSVPNNALISSVRALPVPASSESCDNTNCPPPLRHYARAAEPVGRIPRVLRGSVTSRRADSPTGSSSVVDSGGNVPDDSACAPSVQRAWCRCRYINSDDFELGQHDRIDEHSQLRNSSTLLGCA
jgi:hypothetical protein